MTYSRIKMSSKVLLIFVLNVLTVMLMFDDSINRYELTWPGQKLKLTPEGGVVGPQ